MDHVARSDRLAQLLELLEDAVVVRPNGDVFQVVRENGWLRYLPVDVEALTWRLPRPSRAALS